MHLPPPTPMTSFAPYVRASATIEPTVVSLQKPEKGWTLYSTPDSRRPFSTSGPAISHAVRPATTSARSAKSFASRPASAAAPGVWMYLPAPRMIWAPSLIETNSFYCLPSGLSPNT